MCRLRACTFLMLLAVSGAERCPPRKLMKPCKCESDFEAPDENPYAIKLSCRKLNETTLTNLVSAVKRYTFQTVLLERYLSDRLPGNRTLAGLNVRHLIIKRSKVATLEKATFAGMSKVKAIEIVQNRKLRTIKAGAFKRLNSLITIRITHSKIKRFPRKAFLGAKNLQFLYLNNNKVTSLRKNSFEGLNALTELDLQMNRLKTLSSNAFRLLANLQVLTLHTNRITRVDYQAFYVLSRLTFLGMSDNRITKLPFGLLFPLMNLETFEMTDNLLKDIMVGTFSRNQMLKTIALQRNVISNLKVGAFTGPARLQTLNLCQNLIKSISVGVFDGLTLLSSLLLSSNEIYQIEPGALRTNKTGACFCAQNLERLLLDGNRLAYLHPHMFSYMPQLRTLSVSDNNILAVPHNLFRQSVNDCGCKGGVANLEFLSMDNNNICFLNPDTLSGLSDKIMDIGLEGEWSDELTSTSLPLH